jgi:hypothetical protein
LTLLIRTDYNFSLRRKMIKWIQLVMAILKTTWKLVSKITHIYTTNIMGKKIVKKKKDIMGKNNTTSYSPHFQRERIVKSHLNIKSFHKIVIVIIQDNSTWLRAISEVIGTIHIHFDHSKTRFHPLQMSNCVATHYKKKLI